MPQELVDQLLELSSRTDGGLNASPAKRQQIEELVDELEAFCPRNPLRSPLLYGDYEVGGSCWLPPCVCVWSYACWTGCVGVPLLMSSCTRVDRSA